MKMKKKPKTSERQLKKEIKQLNNRLEHKQQTIDDYYSKISDFEEKERERKSIYRVTQENNKEHEEETSKKLFEIIRWLINKDTANDPFNTLKERKIFNLALLDALKEIKHKVEPHYFSSDSTPREKSEAIGWGDCRSKVIQALDAYLNNIKSLRDKQ